MKKLILCSIFCLLSSAVLYAGFQTGKTTAVVLESFNTGQVSPSLEARQNFPKYDSACRTLENFLVSPLGPVQRRPGTRYIATAKTGTPRLLKFEYSTGDSYAIEAGDDYARFYRNGGQILDPNNNPYEIVTPYQQSELADIRYAQSDNWMYMVDGNDPPNLLTRTGHAAWTCTEIVFDGGPFLNENDDTGLTIDPSGNGEFTANDYYDSGDDSQGIVRGVSWKAQTFTASDTYTASGVQLKLYKLGDPGTVTVSLRATAAGLPTGADLVSGTTDGDSLTTSAGGEWREITFTATQALTSGTVYAVVVRATSGDASNTVYWRHDSTSPSYTGGSYIYSADSGSSWTASASADFMFRIAISGTASDVIGLAANGPIFDSEHVGALWRLSHTVPTVTTTGTFTATSFTVPVAEQLGTQFNVARNQDYIVAVSGYWKGVATIQKTYDSGTTWKDVFSHQNVTGLNPLDFRGTETVQDAIYRVKMVNHLGVQFHRHEWYVTSNYTCTALSYVRQGIVRIATYTDPCNVTASVLYTLGGTDKTYLWAEGAWSDYRGWPRTVAFHQQRALYGGSESYPTTLWFSGTGSDNFDDFTIGNLATDAFTVQLQGQNPIEWLISGDYLLIGTSAGVGKFGLQGKPINVDSGYIEQSTNGSASIQAVMTSDTVLYVERNLRKIREFGYALQYDRYVTPDLTVLCEEITDPCVVEIAFQHRPNPMLWCVLGNGNIATLCYYRDQAVAGWSLQTTTGDFESLVITPGAGTTQTGDTWREDALYTVATRNVDGNDVSFIEQFAPVSYGSDPNYAWFVDCGLSTAYSGLTPAAQTFTGMSHLATESVCVYADANSIGARTVNASGVIDCNAVYTIVTAGLNFTSKLETLPLKLPAEIAQARIADRKVSALNFDLQNANYFKYGMGASATLQTADFQDVFVTSVVGFKRITFPFGSLSKPTLYVECSEPVPLGLRAIIGEVYYTIP